ncbi:hypothetical protein AGABI1DRAFT_84581 [Agaricus bisporus var. burnettii JB137-S8]|uniref:Uncharacterized protein n=1 Tax=Agaricus bisporus var. burnettii (strain JB137-S8 / ATCC MYA-4627 / FGSC 10392) TaxID=597362 RepID=K5XAP0_AGABU|nr:uncharacterized protein AGABI1DRAFT_84581 [Agaricus bisporus var. burnettii JB137-S8]EKM80097.1 hypothetical protein AGABI1DRAFT_84581 [Agaricus bisporus var. burnettii JB137-S8]
MEAMNGCVKTVDRWNATTDDGQHSGTHHSVDTSITSASGMSRSMGEPLADFLIA